MNVLVSVWEFFQVNILTNPAFFVGFIVLIGYLLLRRPVMDAIAGFIKATVGYLILNVAAGGLVSNFRPILAALNERFGLSAAVIDPYFGQAAAHAAFEKAGQALGMTMIVLVIAFFTNIFLVMFRRITKVRTVFITGHIMVLQSTTALWLMFFAFGNLSTPVIVTLGILLGLYWSVSANLTVELTQNLTDGGGFAVGHQQMFGIWLTDKLAGWLSKKGETKRIEDLNLPGFLKVFNDNTVTTGILMIIFFGIIIGILGPELMASIDPAVGNKSFVFYIIEKSLHFAVYLAILQLGVRMFVAELSESFTGISEKLLPGSMPAVDCAATYGFGHPNAVTLGFLFGALGQFLMILGLVIFKSPVLIITGFVPVFFDNATFAVFANKRGGVRAAMLAPFLSGIIQVLGGAFAVYFFQLAEFGGWHGNFDWALAWPIFGVLLKYGKYIGVAAIALFLLLIPQLQYRRNKEHYFTVAEDYEAYKEATSKA